MMNRYEGSGSSEARVRYLDADFQVLSPGAFVRCAVTGKAIPLDELKYWSVAHGNPTSISRLRYSGSWKSIPGRDTADGPI